MFSHIMVGANDVEKLKVFYDAVLGELGHKTGLIAPRGDVFTTLESNYISRNVKDDKKAESRCRVDKWQSRDTGVQTALCRGICCQ